MIVGDPTVGVDHYPQRELGAVLSRIAELREQLPVVDRDIVTEVHELLESLNRLECRGGSLLVAKSAVDGHAKDLHAELSPLAEKKIEIPDLTIGFDERFILVFPEMQH